MTYMNNIPVPECADATRAVAWIDKSLIAQNAEILGVSNFNDREYDELCEYVSNEMNSDKSHWKEWWNEYHWFIKTAMMMKKMNLVCDEPRAIFCSCCGSLHENVYILDVSEQASNYPDPVSHAFTASSDEHAIEVAESIVYHRYRRQLRNDAWIELMKPVPGENGKAFYDECDFDCIHSFSMEAE